MNASAALRAAREEQEHCDRSMCIECYIAHERALEAEEAHA